MSSTKPYETQELFEGFGEMMESLLAPQFPHTQNASPAKDYSRPRADGKKIEHEHIDLLGHTTNVLVFSYFDSNPDKKFSRDDIRLAIESHKKSLKGYLMPRDISRIQSGKAAVDYWIDRLVEHDEIEKQNSNPVRFWRTSSTSNEKSKQQLQVIPPERNPPQPFPINTEWA